MWTNLTEIMRMGTCNFVCSFEINERQGEGGTNLVGDAEILRKW